MNSTIIPMRKFCMCVPSSTADDLILALISSFASWHAYTMSALGVDQCAFMMPHAGTHRSIPSICDHAAGGQCAVRCNMGERRDLCAPAEHERDDKAPSSGVGSDGKASVEDGETSASVAGDHAGLLGVLSMTTALTPVRKSGVAPVCEFV